MVEAGRESSWSLFTEERTVRRRRRPKGSIRKGGSVPCLAGCKCKKRSPRPNKRKKRNL